jgi:titin
VILRGSGHTIGGSTLADRNVISGNDNGLFVSNATNSSIANNYIGVDSSGTVDLGNGSPGIWIQDVSNNITIGGATVASRNVIAGNNGDGIRLRGVDVDNVSVIGNFIGTDANGTTAIVNDGAGVRIELGANSNTIGGITSSERNIISGNANDGILIADIGSSLNQVFGNYIGTDVSGQSAVPNGAGLTLTAPNNRIGSGVAGAGNLISGNSGDGVKILGANANNNLIQGNIVGLNASGDTDLGNSLVGIAMQLGANNNTIGVDGDGVNDVGEGNIVAGNNTLGIRIVDAGSDSNIVAGNKIGTDITGTIASEPIRTQFRMSLSAI